MKQTNWLKCNLGLYILLNLNVSKWPALVEVCTLQLLPSIELKTAYGTFNGIFIGTIRARISVAFHHIVAIQGILLLQGSVCMNWNVSSDFTPYYTDGEGAVAQNALPPVTSVRSLPAAIKDHLFSRQHRPYFPLFGGLEVFNVIRHLLACSSVDILINKMLQFTRGLQRYAVTFMNLTPQNPTCTVKFISSHSVQTDGSEHVSNTWPYVALPCNS